MHARLFSRMDVSEGQRMRRALASQSFRPAGSLSFAPWLSIDKTGLCCNCIGQLLPRCMKPLSTFQDRSVASSFSTRAKPYSVPAWPVTSATLEQEREVMQKSFVEQAQEIATVKGQEASMEKVLEYGLPDEYPHPLSRTQTWTPNLIGDICSKADSAGYKTVCGKSAAEFIRAACHVNFEPFHHAGSKACNEAASNVMEAFYVLMQAMVMSRQVALCDVLVLAGEPESDRESVVLQAIQAVMHVLTMNWFREQKNRLSFGVKGAGTTTLFHAIGLATAMIDFANPDIIVCPAYVRTPSGVAPLAYISDVLHQRGILNGGDDKLYEWGNPGFSHGPGNLSNWLRKKFQESRKRIVPLLLVDQVSKLDEVPNSYKVWLRFIRELTSIVEWSSPTVMRLTGSLAEAPLYLFRFPCARSLRGYKMGTEHLHSLSVSAEALLFCLISNGTDKPWLAAALAKAIAKRMLEDDRLVLLRKHGFLSPVPLVEVDGEPAGPILITMKDVERWREHDPDWKNGALRGEELAEILVQSTGGIPRFLARSVDEIMSDTLGDRLKWDIDNNPTFARFIRWLTHQNLQFNRRMRVYPEHDFFDKGVEHSDRKVMEVLGDSGQVMDGATPPPAAAAGAGAAASASAASASTEDGNEERMRKHVVEFMNWCSERGHVVAETDRAMFDTGCLIRFDSKPLHLVANAHLNGVGDRLAPMELEGLSRAGGPMTESAIRNYMPGSIHAMELERLSRAVGPIAKEALLGLMAEGLALNGLSLIGESVGLEGTLGFRRLDCDAWMQSILDPVPDSGKVREQARLEKLCLDTAPGEEIPLNTVLKEIHSSRKADLIAVCVADGSDEAAVIRVRVHMGCFDTWQSKDLQDFASSWSHDGADGQPSVLSCLQRASNLQHIKTWTHVPVWLSLEPFPYLVVEDQRLQKVCGEDFWRMAIPAVQLTASGLYNFAPEYSPAEKLELLSRADRELVYEANVRQQGRD